MIRGLLWFCIRHLIDLVFISYQLLKLEIMRFGTNIK
ncbi:hypothetical protein LINPERHAP2_LOCUS29183, partial [Linum perenne]